MHSEAEKLSIFHWSTKIDANNSNLHISNMPQHKQLFEKSRTRYLKQQKTLESHISDLASSLSSVNLSNNKKILLQIEKEAMQPTIPSQATVDSVSTVLSATLKILWNHLKLEHTTSEIETKTQK